MAAAAATAGGAAAIPFTASAITAGEAHTCAIHNTAAEGETEVLAARCWGNNGSGRLGDNSVAEKNLPVAVNMLDSGVARISAGNAHTCAIHNTADEGETEVLAAKCWGHNDFGRLGNGSDDARSLIPVQVTGLVSGVTAISAGAQHTCAIHNTAAEGATEVLAAKCWGGNGMGKLGDGSTGNSNIPVQVTGLDSDVTAISAGVTHTCAIHNTAAAGAAEMLAAKCWGFNNGQLGDGMNDNSNTPVHVTGLISDVTAISAGKDHTCAIHDHAAKCWGDNASGELGNNATADSSTAVQVMGLGSGGHCPSQQGLITLVPFTMGPPSAGGSTAVDSWATAAPVTAMFL